MDEDFFSTLTIIENDKIQLENKEFETIDIINPRYIISIEISIPCMKGEPNICINTTRNSYKCHANKEEIKKLKAIKFE